MKTLNIDVSQVSGIDPLTIGKRFRMPVRRSSLPGEETLLKAGLTAFAAVNSTSGGVVKDALAFAGNPKFTLNVTGAIAAAPKRSCPDFTLCLGPNASAGAVVAFGAGGGVYFSNKSPSGEIGLYGGYSVGMITNIGVSLVGQVTFLFGPPATVLAGESLIVGVDVGGKLVSGGGYLIFSISPLNWIGVSWAIGVGASCLPLNLSVQVSKTWIKPLATLP